MALIPFLQLLLQLAVVLVEDTKPMWTSTLALLAVLVVVVVVITPLEETLELELQTKDLLVEHL
jgi:hypothetical protein